jgi:hypothetical protein
VIARDEAPATFMAWDELIDAVATTTPTDLAERARTIARVSLDPTVPEVPRSDATAFAEQMVVDVASMTPDVRKPGWPNSVPAPQRSSWLCGPRT